LIFIDLPQMDAKPQREAIFTRYGLAKNLQYSRRLAMRPNQCAPTIPVHSGIPGGDSRLPRLPGDAAR
jgi:hypothetical protein